MSQAFALEGKITVPRLVPPQPQFIAAAPERSVDYFRIRIDPEKSGTTDRVVRFEFTDGDKPVVGLHIRRAVAEYLPDPDKHYRIADLVVALTCQAWARLYLSQASIQEVAEAGELRVTQGTVEEAADLFEMFDRYSPEKAVLMAPHLHEPG
jgi:alkyl sulfatase BDS1-like metallo-beta-lactamase superfamily hydrolase